MDNFFDLNNNKIVPQYNVVKQKYAPEEKVLLGEIRENLVDLAIENDYKIVLWNIDTKDWAHTSKEEIVEKVISNSSGGDIILFHDYLTGKNNTVEALEIIIPKLINSGYEFVTAGELLQE